MKDGLNNRTKVPPRGTVSSFTGVWLVMLVVPLGIYVTSVKVHTQSVGVIFVARVDPLPTDPCLPSPNLKKYNLPTHVIVERLDFFLSGYNHSIAVFLSSGFREGFPLHYEGDPGSSDANNLISATENPDVVDAKISKELKAGHLAGPFQTRPFFPFRISPLGVVPKKTPGEFRLINHLSYPRGSSLMMVSPKTIQVFPMQLFQMPSGTLRLQVVGVF